MSYERFKKALVLAEKCVGYEIGEGVVDKIIDTAQEKLGLFFSRQFCEYLKRFSYMEFFGIEIYGIIKDDFSGIPEGNIVESTIDSRKKYNLPISWIPIYNYGYGPKAYLDYSHLNIEDEPRVVMATYIGNEYAINEVIAEDFGDFLLQLIEEQLGDTELPPALNRNNLKK